MQERYRVYMQRYHMLVEEMGDIVNLNFKPNVLNTVKLGEQMKLDLKRAREEDQKF